MSERAFLGSPMRTRLHASFCLVSAGFAGALAGCSGTFSTQETDGGDDGATADVVTAPGNDGSSDAAADARSGRDASERNSARADAATSEAATGPDATSVSDATSDSPLTEDATSADAADAPDETCAGLTCNGSCVPSDIRNCGACGNACPPVANGSATCSGSVCGVACAAGFTVGCDGKSCVPLPNEGIGVFVAPGGATTACGSPANPCGTIAAALSVAATTGSSVVYLLPGTYGETVVLSSNVTIQGGWAYAGNDKFAPVCSADPASVAIIKGTGGAGVITAGSAGVIVTGGSPTLDTVTVRSKDTASTGESLYGVFAVNAGTVTLRNVDVQVAGGGTGQAGIQGAPGSTPVSTVCVVDTGNPGTNAPPGAGASAGTWSAGGFISNGGSMGTTGGIGHNGAAGLPGGCVSSVDACGGTPPACSLVITSGTYCASPGKSGCGGGGAGPGTPGGGAGSSVAVFAWKSQVVATGTFKTGPGGTGGQGGNTGKPGAGSTGSPGADLLQDSTCKTSLCGPGHNVPCCVGATSSVAAPGGMGSVGGTGGLGSQGGGGSGGDAYCFVSGGGGTIVAPSAACTYGTLPFHGGNFGDGPSQGADGTAGASLALP